jgi:nickel-dependent lactate racemase
MMEAANMLGPDFLINTILSDDASIAAVFSGDYVKAHQAGCEYLDENFKLNINKKADLVIAAAGGGSKDLNFVQSHKAMENASFALKEGGVMVLIAESSEGFPGDEYMKWVNMGSAEAILKGLSKNFTIPGHTIHAAFEKAERFKIIWVSKLDGMIVSKMGITPTDSIASALDMAYGMVGEKQTTYVIPQAYSTFPSYSAE